MYKKILIALSFDARVDKILHARLKDLLQANENAEVHLIHAVEQIVAMGLAYGLSLNPELVADLKQDAQKHMQRQAKVFASKTAEVKLGSARDVILEQLEDLNADLVIVGSHVQSGLSTLLGSTANAICHNATSDVLAVRTQKPD
ncbi:MAG: universal stress protein [Candidatus Thioglobus sp.]